MFTDEQCRIEANRIMQADYSTKSATEALASYKVALTELGKINQKTKDDIRLLAKGYYGIGKTLCSLKGTPYILEAMENFEKAADALSQVIEKTENDYFELAGIYGEISFYATQLENYDKSIRAHEEEIAIRSEIQKANGDIPDNNSALGFAYLGIIHNYKNTQQYGPSEIACINFINVLAVGKKKKWKYQTLATFYDLRASIYLKGNPREKFFSLAAKAFTDESTRSELEQDFWQMYDLIYQGEIFSDSIQFQRDLLRFMQILHELVVFKIKMKKLEILIEQLEQLEQSEQLGNFASSKITDSQVQSFMQNVENQDETLTGLHFLSESKLITALQKDMNKYESALGNLKKKVTGLEEQGLLSIIMKMPYVGSEYKYKGIENQFRNKINDLDKTENKDKYTYQKLSNCYRDWSNLSDLNHDKANFLSLAEGAFTDTTTGSCCDFWRIHYSVCSGDVLGDPLQFKKDLFQFMRIMNPLIEAADVPVINNGLIKELRKQKKVYQEKLSDLDGGVPSLKDIVLYHPSLTIALQKSVEKLEQPTEKNELLEENKIGSPDGQRMPKAKNIPWFVAELAREERKRKLESKEELNPKRHKFS